MQRLISSWSGFDQGDTGVVRERIDDFWTWSGGDRCVRWIGVIADMDVSFCAEHEGSGLIASEGR